MWKQSLVGLSLELKTKMKSPEDSSKEGDGRDPAKNQAKSLEDVVATPRRPTPSCPYEVLRQKTLEDNFQELQSQGLASSLISPKQKRPSIAKRKQRTSEPSPLRRTSRSKARTEFFHNEDFSRSGTSFKRAQQKKVRKHFQVKLTVLAQTLINKLAAEAFLRTQKLATVEAQKLAETASSACMNSNGKRVRKSKPQRRTKRKLDKALDLYSMTWMPKGTRCKL